MKCPNYHSNQRVPFFLPDGMINNNRDNDPMTIFITCQNHRASAPLSPDRGEGSVALYLYGRFRDNGYKQDCEITGTYTAVNKQQ